MDVKTRIVQVVGDRGIVAGSDRDAYAIDGVVPTVVVAPDTVEQVSWLLVCADEAGLTVVPWGGGTAIGVGNVPKRVDIVLSMHRLARVVDYSPDDMTVTAQAGVTLTELQKLLAGRDQMLPLDPPLPERSTVGGILATNASGPLRYHFGTPRDIVLGTVVVYPYGTVAKAGGRTVKNVAGYDMSRLHIGAYGTLGVIVEATFKVSPLPKVLATAAGRFDTLAGAVAAARALRMARIVPWSLVLLMPGTLPDRAEGYTVAVRLGGQAAVVNPQVQRALDTLQEAKGKDVAALADEETFWARVRDWPATVAGVALARIGCTPSQTQAMLTAVQDAAAEHGLGVSWLALPGAATVYSCFSGSEDGVARALTSLATTAASVNGNVVVERSSLVLKKQVSIWTPHSADTLTRRVKETFDPRGTLNPGRFVGGL